MELKEELSGRITKQHCLGCKVAMAFNILWAISNYFIITQNTWIYVSINIGVAEYCQTLELFQWSLPTLVS